MSTDPREQGDDRNASRLAEDLARGAEKLWRTRRPQVARFIEQSRPVAADATKRALRYAQEHEDEIKRAALKGARLRLPGPFGYVVGALADAADRDSRSKQAAVCPACRSQNPLAARFCNQCGARLAT